MISRSVIRRAAATALAAIAALTALGAAWPRAAGAADYLPGVVVVGYRSRPVASDARVATTMGVRQAGQEVSPGVRVLRLPRGESVRSAIARLRREPGVAYAVPDVLAHVAASPFVPDDPGKAHVSGGWEKLQWNFLPDVGIDAPDAWANLIADGRPGGRGVVVAILDTGVAYRNWREFRRSPDFAGTRFIDPHDFVDNNRFPLDRNGHGTVVAGEVAEATNNNFGLTGLAYGATIMPVRVLDKNGFGDAITISKGIRYATTHGAQVINLSLEFPLGTPVGEIPDIISAIRFAHRRGVVVVAASGNDSSPELAYPARAPAVISVGGTTQDRCLANYSNGGTRLDLVAPGGGDDASMPGDPNCNPLRQHLPDVYQMTFPNPKHPGKFGFPGGWFGTSMASPQVAATAALVIASGVLGRRPSPDQVLARLESTAQPLGGKTPNANYGYGLLDAAAATAPIAPPPAPPTQPTPQPQPTG